MEHAEHKEKPEQREKAEKTPASVIGADIVITGNIEASFGLLIEGRIKGDVRCTTLILGENSSVTGSIYAERTRVMGTIDGSVDTKDLAIEGTGRVIGDVSYERLKIASGGSVEGNMKRKAAESSAEAAAKLKLVEPPASTEKPSDPNHIYIE